MNASQTVTSVDSAAPVASAPKTAEDRASTFQATEGGTAHYSGETLLIEAYSAVWLILMAWLIALWRKERAMATRLQGLEQALDRAAAKLDRR